MTLVLTLAAAVVVALGLAGTAAARRLAGRDHRCRVATLPSGCSACTAVRRGTGQGGHMVCACGARSLHATGVALLAWRAEHHGDPFPDVAGAPGATAGTAVVATAASHTRVHAAQEAEAADFVRLLEERSEADRRAVERARRRPNPLTPQVLREAGYSAEEAAAVIERLGSEPDQQ